MFNFNILNISKQLAASMFAVAIMLLTCTCPLLSRVVFLRLSDLAKIYFNYICYTCMLGREFFSRLLN